MLSLKSLFPTLGDKSNKVDNRNPHYTKKGSGRHHNHTKSDRLEKEERINNQWLRGKKFLRKGLRGQAVHTN
ncbi:hypothetical protein [Flavobacterium sp.]|jgi:hypothetical protein|uniref:hypothetical protein n=1 Tax=Flavobacterium sp. TaxID=239 RepID=UPI0037BF6616